VIGEPSDFFFRMGGYTAFRALAQAVREATGAELTAYPRVLDWGCGCGRVSRYFLPLPGVSVAGVDVDPENVAWCRANLPGGAWDVVPLRPPTDLPTAGFDLAFGVSVFTHLGEPEQFAWLEELRRVVRPGGLALMTFHGEASLVWSRLSAERYTQLRRDGFCEQPNPLYDADLGEADYYRDVFHTAEYVRREWGKYFEIVAIKPTWVAHQDLVVMRRR
jgi:SAM-dependent methyltransferase